MRILKKIATILALLIGIMSVFAGSKVLLSIDVKDYTVLTWLVSYNVIFGFISIITAYFLWKDSNLGKLMTWFILSAHFIVFLYLNLFSDAAATESKMAMLFRAIIWVIITVLFILIPKYFNKKAK